jgi:hypothetical protein
MKYMRCNLAACLHIAIRSLEQICEAFRYAIFPKCSYTSHTKQCSKKQLCCNAFGTDGRPRRLPTYVSFCSEKGSSQESRVVVFHASLISKCVGERMKAKLSSLLPCGLTTLRQSRTSLVKITKLAPYRSLHASCFHASRSGRSTTTCRGRRIPQRHRHK